MTHLSWLLMWFEALLGLKINLDKSELIPSERVADVDSLAPELGCKVGKLPSTYLGLPLRALVDQKQYGMLWKKSFAKNCHCGKNIYISKERRLTFISTLPNLTIYYVSLFFIPRNVRLRLKKIQRDFL